LFDDELLLPSSSPHPAKIRQTAKTATPIRRISLSFQICRHEDYIGVRTGQ
jgi:hypothetical protein